MDRTQKWMGSVGCLGQIENIKRQSLLNDNHIQISMTESGDPKDNAKAERINNTMKNELLKDMRFTSIEEVIRAVARAVDFYNNDRPHMSIDMMTPAMAALCVGKIKKRWISYREKAIREKQALEIPENSGSSAI